MTKIAVVLFNLGGPDHLDAVEPFLRNLFRDPAIIRLPALLRHPVARLIAKRRAVIARDIYAKIGGRSPLFENTQAQARALEKELADLGAVQSFVAMRYWHPFAEGAVRAVKDFAPDEIVLLPLYPQFSTTTTASSLAAWKKAARKAKLTAPEKTICCYPVTPGFIAALAENTRAELEKALAANGCALMQSKTGIKPHGVPRVLFSAHGLPEKIVKGGDPYQFQCGQTAAALAKELGLEPADWVLCYQSRVGPLTWIGPSAEQEIARAGRDRVPVVMAPIAFVSEHSETLYEIAMLFRDLAAKAGVPYFAAVSAVGTNPAFIKGLAGLVREALENPNACASVNGARLCPPEFSGCACRKKTEKEPHHVLRMA
jgi:ferrochelatase